jgi:uncharacterized membrane protein
MNRAEFLAALERGLKRLPPRERAAILADYDAYFADGAAAGRPEQELAESLGSPTLLAAELRLGREAPRSAVRAFGALLAVVMFNAVVWLPLVLGVFLVLALAGLGATLLGYAAFTLLVDPFDQPLGGVIAVLLRALGLFAACIAAWALARAGVLLLVKFFVRMHHRHRRVLRASTEVST